MGRQKIYKEQIVLKMLKNTKLHIKVIAHYFMFFAKDTLAYHIYSINKREAKL